MGKRSDYARRPNDLYRTRDPRAAQALAPFLPRAALYVEPCAGDGSLIRLLEPWGHICVAASDLHPLDRMARKGLPIQLGDARLLHSVPRPFDCFITNPPWTRELMHPILANLMRLAPVWALFDADWMHTRQAAQLLDNCRDIVAVGRLRWMLGEPEDKGEDPKDNCCWYRLDIRHRGGPRFHGRPAQP